MGIRLLIADDHPWIREGLRAVFEHTEIEVVGEAADGDEAVRLIQGHCSDMVLLDITMPGLDGFEVLREVKEDRPDLPVVIYSQHTRSDFKRRARELGASAYLEKAISAEELTDAIRRVAQGERLWDQALTTV